MTRFDPHVEAFNRDVLTHAGYLYTTNARWSSYLANRRQTDAALAAVDFRGKRAIDIGCGDGAYTIELFDRGHPDMMFGIDAAREAIKVAEEKAQGRKITFAVYSAYGMPFEDGSFDIAHLRGALHHMKNPVDALREAFRIARTLVVIEPNGYNVVLKIIERFSRYHVEHQEKSYMPRTLDNWIDSLGGVLTKRQWFGLVPFFCPDWFAQAMKWLEPLVEGLPVLSTIACGSYIFVATRANK